MQCRKPALCGQLGRCDCGAECTCNSRVVYCGAPPPCPQHGHSSEEFRRAYEGQRNNIQDLKPATRRALGIDTRDQQIAILQANLNEAIRMLKEAGFQCERCPWECYFLGPSDVYHSYHHPDCPLIALLAKVDPEGVK